MGIDRKIRLSIEQPKKPFLDYLSRRTALQESFKYMLWLDDTVKMKQYRGKDFYGVIDGTHFKIVQIVYGKNFFTPILSGVFSMHAGYDEKTTIELEILNSPCIQLINILLCVMFCLHVLALVTTHELLCIVFIAFDFFAFSVFSIINYHYIKKTWVIIKSELFGSEIME